MRYVRATWGEIAEASLVTLLVLSLPLLALIAAVRMFLTLGGIWSVTATDTTTALIIAADVLVVVVSILVFKWLPGRRVTSPP